MSAIDILLIVLVLIAAGLAVRSVVKRRKSGGCGCPDCAAPCSQRKNRK